MTKQPTIIAIGGGSLTGMNTPASTQSIDRAILEAARVKKPRVLFIPTASNDHEGYIQLFTKAYQQLGAEVETLRLVSECPQMQVIEQRIAFADVIYVGGGNTLQMMKRWRRLGIDLLLKKAWQRGAVMCGLSAGSICWFESGNSDSWKSFDASKPYIRVQTLDLLPIMHCPHYNSEPERQESVRIMTKKYRRIMLALDDYAALYVKGDRFKVISAHESALARKLWWHNGRYEQHIITPSVEWRSTQLLFNPFEMAL